MKYLILSILYMLAYGAQAQALKVGKGRISLINLPGQIISKTSIAQNDFIKVYQISSNEDFKIKNALAVQGLVDQGQTSFFVHTNKGIKSFEVSLDEGSSEILDLNPQKPIANFGLRELKTNSSLMVQSPFYINELVLASNPGLLELDPFFDYYDPKYLKAFILKTKDHEAITDLIVPSAQKIFKFSLKLSPNQGGQSDVLNLI